MAVNRILLKVLRKVVHFILGLNSNLPAILEVEMQHIQGKGSGDFSVVVEAKTVIDFYFGLE